jgi:DNA-binding transcriptional LysR family regulator
MQFGVVCGVPNGVAIGATTMIRDLDVSLLRAFVAVIDSGSVTNAARLLNRTQAAVSLQIKRLEDEFGQDLFLREHRKMTLTQPGEKLLGPARALLRLNDDLWGQMTTPAFEGEVRLGVPVDIIATYVPQVLKRFHKAWPRVRVTMVAKNSFDLLEDLRTGAIDLTLTTDREAGVGAEVLRTDALVWVGVKGGEAHQQTPLPISTGTRTCRFRPVILDALRSVGRDWRVVLAISNQDAVNATVSAGVTIAAMLRENVPADLVVLGTEDGLPALPDFLINLSLPPTGGTDVAQALAAHIRDEFSSRFGDRRRPASRVINARGVAA